MKMTAMLNVLQILLLQEIFVKNVIVLVWIVQEVLQRYAQHARQTDL